MAHGSKMHPARLERAIFGFGGRRLIHWATGAIKAMSHEAKALSENLMAQHSWLMAELACPEGFEPPTF